MSGSTGGDQAAAVLEASTWAMMLINFAGLGFLGYFGASAQKERISARLKRGASQ